MLRRSLVFALFASTVSTAATAEAPAKRNPWLDLPDLIEARHLTQNNWIWIRCNAIQNTSPRAAACTLSQLTISKPEVQTATRAEIERLTRTWSSETQRACSSYVNDKTPRRAASRRKYRADLVAACQAKELEQLERVMLDHVEHEEQSCELTQSPPESIVFTQINENTWSAASDPRLSACGITTVRTLWRADSGVGTPWSLTQTMTVPPNAPKSENPFLDCSGFKTSTAEWVFFDHDPIPLGCAFAGH
jgi:hypothetical protein